MLCNTSIKWSRSFSTSRGESAIGPRSFTTSEIIRANEGVRRSRAKVRRPTPAENADKAEASSAEGVVDAQMQEGVVLHEQDDTGNVEHWKLSILGRERLHSQPARAHDNSAPMGT